MTLVLIVLAIAVVGFTVFGVVVIGLRQEERHLSFAGRPPTRTAAFTRWLLQLYVRDVREGSIDDLDRSERVSTQSEGR